MSAAKRLSIATDGFRGATTNRRLAIATAGFILLAGGSDVTQPVTGIELAAAQASVVPYVTYTPVGAAVSVEVGNNTISSTKPVIGQTIYIAADRDVSISSALILQGQSTSANAGVSGYDLAPQLTGETATTVYGDASVWFSSTYTAGGQSITSDVGAVDLGIISNAYLDVTGGEVSAEVGNLHPASSIAVTSPALSFSVGDASAVLVSNPTVIPPDAYVLASAGKAGVGVEFSVTGPQATALVGNANPYVSVASSGFDVASFTGDVSIDTTADFTALVSGSSIDVTVGGVVVDAEVNANAATTGLEVTAFTGTVVLDILSNIAYAGSVHASVGAGDVTFDIRSVFEGRRGGLGRSGGIATVVSANVKLLNS